MIFSDTNGNISGFDPFEYDLRLTAHQKTANEKNLDYFY